MGAHVGVHRLAVCLLIEDRVAVVHAQACLPVMEVHVGEDLLTEVGHESVKAEVEDLVDLPLPPADRRRVGEVQQRDRGAGGARRHVGATLGVLDRVPGPVGGRARRDPGPQVGEGMDVQRAETGDDPGLHGRADERREREAVIAASGEAPALDPVGGQRQPVADDVGHVLLKFGLIVASGLADVLDEPVEHRSQRPARRYRLAAAAPGEVGDRGGSATGRDDVAQRRCLGRDTPGVWRVGVHAEEGEFRLGEEEAVPG